MPRPRACGRLTIFLRYAIRNALLPQVTGLGIALGQIVSGGLLVEAVFSYPGLGGLLLRAILTKDYFLEQGIVLIIIVSIGFVTLMLDLVYPLLDPRLKADRWSTLGAIVWQPASRVRRTKEMGMDDNVANRRIRSIADNSCARRC